MKTRYTILEPGPIRSRDLVTLDWVDVEFKGDQPTLGDLMVLLTPLFDDGRHVEHVSVNGAKGPTDMFVGDMGVADGLPLNDAATAIYWTAHFMYQIAAAHPSRYDIDRGEAPPPKLQIAAFAAAIDALRSNTTTPRIHGRAVLFADRVWF